MFDYRVDVCIYVDCRVYQGFSIQYNFIPKNTIRTGSRQEGKKKTVRKCQIITLVLYLVCGNG